MVGWSVYLTLRLTRGTVILSPLLVSTKDEIVTHYIRMVANSQSSLKFPILHIFYVVILIDELDSHGPIEILFSIYISLIL